MRLDSRLTRQAVAAGFGLVLALGSTPASGDKFYTFHAGLSHLIEIDTETGNTLDLGFIGGPVLTIGGGDLAMEFVAGTLYWTGASSEDILHLDSAAPTPLGYIGRVPYNTGGAASARQIGGMAWNGTSLVVSYAPCNLCGRLYLLADLSSTGVLTNITDYTSLGIRLSLLAISATGEIYAIDDRRADPVPTGYLYRVHRPGPIDLIGAVPHSPTDPLRVRYNGLAFSDTGDLWVIERTGVVSHILRRLDLATGQVLEDVPINYPSPYPTIALVGLAAIPGGPVPVRASTWGELKDAYRGIAQP